MGSLKVAIGQLCSGSSLRTNARVVNKLIRRAIDENAKVLFLPEAADYISRDPTHSMTLAKSTQKDFIEVIQKELKNIFVDANSAKNTFYIAVGVHEPSQVEAEAAGQAEAAGELRKVQNNQLWINNQGEVLQRYQKLHLFDIAIANGPIVRESNAVEPGSAILAPFAVEPDSKFKVGFGICYDIRFPELALRLRRLGANILTFPSAFTTSTGKAHWKALGTARALDSQSYVIMAAQCGEHNVYADLDAGGAAPPKDGTKSRISYGNSIIIDPWGTVIAECKNFEDDLTADFDSDGDYHEIAFANLDIDFLTKIRLNMPLQEHRRPEIFGYEV